MHILLIDDDPDFAGAVATALIRAGCRVTSVADCESGLEAVATPSAASGFDAVLVDIFMPETDGIETIRALRRAGVRAPVIAMSGGGAARFEGVLGWATALGADASLAKPFDVQRLMTVLASLSTAGAADADGASRPPIGAR